MNTHIQDSLAAAYANLPHQWLQLSEAEVDELGEAMDGRMHTPRPPLPMFPAKEIAMELSRLERKPFRGAPHEL